MSDLNLDDIHRKLKCLSQEVDEARQKSYYKKNNKSNITLPADETVFGGKRSLDDMCEAVSVHEDHNGPEGWYAVSTEDDSIIAYFSTEKEAFRYRLDLINRAMNG